MVVVLLACRESASESATWSASSPAQPLYHGSWPAPCIPGENLLLNYTNISVFLLKCSSQFYLHLCTECVTRSPVWSESKPQVYGYDDLQMLQTRIPLVSSTAVLFHLSSRSGVISPCILVCTQHPETLNKVTKLTVWQR